MTKQIVVSGIIILFFTGIIFATLAVQSGSVPGEKSDTETSEPTISEAYIPSETSTTETTIVEEEIETTVVECVETTETQILTELITTTITETTIIETEINIQIEEKPVTKQVWLYMKNEFGWNDIVCAGIIGNLTAECGGCWTGDLDWTINDSHGIGIAQWVGSRKTELITKYGNNPTLEEQLCFLKDELYGTNGVTKQVTDYQLNQIMNAETPEDCAFAFASYFERCAQQHRYPRKQYARNVYEYFVG